MIADLFFVSSQFADGLDDAGMEAIPLDEISNGDWGSCAWYAVLSAKSRAEATALGRAHCLLNGQLCHHHDIVRKCDVCAGRGRVPAVDPKYHSGAFADALSSHCDPCSGRGWVLR